MELINRRRRQLHVHSVIYYHLHTTIIDDAVFDKWAVELKSLQDAHPESKTQGYLPEVFNTWTGDTGMHLPLTDEVLGLAAWLLREADKRSHTYSHVPKKKPVEKPVRKKKVVWEGDVGYDVNS